MCVYVYRCVYMDGLFVFLPTADGYLQRSILFDGFFDLNAEEVRVARGPRGESIEARASPESKTEATQTEHPHQFCTEQDQLFRLCNQVIN